MKRWITILLPVFIALIIINGILYYVKPLISKAVIGYVQKNVKENFNLDIQIKKFDFQFFTPSVFIEEISLDATSLDKQVQKIEVAKVKINFDLLQLMSGKIYASSLIVENLNTTINLSSSKKDSTADEDDATKKEKIKNKLSELNLNLFSQLKSFPLYRFALVKSNVLIHSPDNGIDVKVSDFDLLVYNLREKLIIQSDISKSNVTIDGQPIDFAFQLDSILNRNSFDIDQMVLNLNKTQIKIKGQFSNVIENLYNPEFVLQYEVSSELKYLSEITTKVFKTPALDGVLNLTGQIDFKDKNRFAGGMKLKSKGIKIDNFVVDQLNFISQFSQNEYKFTKFSLNQDSGNIETSDFRVTLNKDGEKKTYMLSASAEVKDLSIFHLLRNLDVGEVPVKLLVDGDVNCNGPVYPGLEIECKAKANARDLEVKSDMKSNFIITKVAPAQLSGTVKVNTQAVSYLAQIKFPDSVGESDGVINYQTGFKINYSTPSLQIKNILNLAGLKLEGQTEIKGKTEGNSSYATIDMALKGKDIYFEDFFLGNPNIGFRYEKSHLLFKGVDGQINESKYTADIDIDLNKSNIKMTANSNHLNLKDIQAALVRKIPFPIYVSGFGTAHAAVNGPLDIGKMSYDLNSQFKNVEAYGETFQKLQFDVHSTNGNVKIERAIAEKNESMLALTGTANPEGIIAAEVKAVNFKLEESENISRLGSTIVGLLNFDFKLNGPILAPETDFKGQLKNLAIEDQEFQDSFVELKFTRNDLNGKAQLLGQNLKSEFKIPFSNQSPFYLKLTANRWNYTSLFALLGAGSLLNEYEAALTGDLELKSENGGIFNSTGQGTISQLMLKRGPLFLRNQGPMELTTKNGVGTFKNFKLIGDQTSIELTGDQVSQNNLNSKIKGQINLRIAQVFLPFLEDLNGNVEFTSQINGELLKPQILGNAKIQNGFVKIKGFPHPFEKINSDIQFSHSRIIFNRIQSQFASGNLTGDGTIQINGVSNLETAMKMKADNVTLNVPDKIQTSGNADLMVTGKWFPFLISGTYKVYEGLITKDFTAEDSMNTVKQSSYLPKVILRNAFEPIYLDIQVILDKPVQIKNPLMDGFAKGTIGVRGPPLNPILSGKVTFEKPSKIIFQDKSFEITNGNVTFNDPKEINPEIYFAANSRVSEYDISMLVQGKGSAPIVRWTSIPPLSENDIISLLALGVTASNVDKKQSSKDQQDSASYQIGTAIIANNPLSKKIQQSLGVNLQFSSQYDDTKNIAVQKITLSRRINEKLNASMSRLRGEQNSNEYKLQYSINQNVSAVGTYEQREPSETGNSLSKQNEIQSILGIDLEYKQEFK